MGGLKKSSPNCFNWLQKVEEDNMENETDKQAKASFVLFSLKFCLKNCFEISNINLHQSGSGFKIKRTKLYVGIMKYCTRALALLIVLLLDPVQE